MILPAKYPPRRVEDRVLDELQRIARDGAVHVVMDAARITGLRTLLRELGFQHDCLSAGEQDDALRAVAPFLVRLPLAEGTRTLLRWRPEILEASLFLSSTAPMDQLRRHCKRFLRVETVAGHPVFFRFYDPRVFEPFWAACDPMERSVLGGPVDAFLFRDPMDPAISAAPALLGCEPGPDGARGTLPTARHPFRLTPRHESALREDARRRFRVRALQYLERRCQDRGRPHPSETLECALDRAFLLAPHVGLVAGRDVGALADAILAGHGDQARRLLPRLDSELRSGTLRQFCEGMRS